MPTAILSALPEEQAGLSSALAQAEAVPHGGRTFWRGLLMGRPVVLALSGMGKVAAACTATQLIERFGVQRVLFTGVAGGLGEGVRVGDVVVAIHYLQHDMDASPLFARWQVPGLPRMELPCDARLTALLIQASAQAIPASQQLHQGLVVSGDRFVSTAAESTALRRALESAGHTALAVEMEGAAVAQVCQQYGLPFAALRSISDRADDTAHVDFHHFVQTVASRYAHEIVPAFVQML